MAKIDRDRQALDIAAMKAAETLTIYCRGRKCDRKYCIFASGPNCLVNNPAAYDIDMAEPVRVINNKGGCR